LPFCYLTLLAKKPTSGAYPKKLVTLGNHLRKRRLDLGLLQKDVAVLIGVDTNTITIWEKNRGGPKLKFVPRIIDFLGYEPPCPATEMLGQKIRQYRYIWGISQKDLAKRIGIDPTTSSRLERNQGRSFPSVFRRVVPGGRSVKRNLKGNWELTR